MLILLVTPSFLQTFFPVTDSRLPSRFHSLVCFTLWGDSFPVRMCSLNYSMRISFPDITHFTACHIVLSHSFSSGSLKDVLKPERKIKVVSKISHVLCTFTVVLRWALI